jgi:cytochrome d ubiquinol oxidase subunit II
MTLQEAPLVAMLVGLVAYVVLGGADFGAGMWTLTGWGPHGRRVRQHARHTMGPVWEANHVWLIYVLVVCWTAYPVAFGSIASTLVIPLLVAALGIILRAATYVMRSVAPDMLDLRGVETGFALSSVLTPFALGAVIGGIASARVPVGNARGDLLTSWLNPTSVVVGAIAVAAGAYLAAVYLAADARRIGDDGIVEAFRRRAFVSGAIAGVLALVGLVVIRSDAEPIWDGLTHGAGLVALVAAIAAGVASILLVVVRRLGLARVGAAGAVAAVIAGWAIAQSPRFLPGLTISEAAASRATLIAILVALAIGGIVLAPSLGLLFALFLRGTFDPGRAAPAGGEGAMAIWPSRDGQLASGPARLPWGWITVACFVAGSVLMQLDSSWLMGVGVVALVASVATGFVRLALPALVADADAGQAAARSSGASSSV